MAITKMLSGKRLSFRNLLSVVLMFVVFSVKVSAQSPCPVLTNENRAQLEQFVKSWYHLPQEQTMTLVDSDTVDVSCYRKLVFRASVRAPLLKLYLAPDGRHLITGLMDLMADPAVTQRQNQAELDKQLTERSLLTSEASQTPVSLVIFSDFQCPYCKQLAETIQQLTPEEHSHLAITFRQLPLNIHSWAQKAAEISTCVALQNKPAFWQLHDFLFAQQQALSPETIQGKVLSFVSRQTKVDPKAVLDCLAQKTFESPLQRDEQLAKDLGIMSTPSIFLNGRRLSVRSVADLRAALQATEPNAVVAQLGTKANSNNSQVACTWLTNAQCVARQSLCPGKEFRSSFVNLKQ